MTPNYIEIMCAAHWDVGAARKWKDIPEDWKPFYRRAMTAAMEARESAADYARMRAPDGLSFGGIPLVVDPTFEPLENLDKTP